MSRIFLTGGSGYIGEEVLQVLQETHPEYEISVLVRDSVKEEMISRTFPGVRTVLGDLDSTSLIGVEARNADIIVNAASSNHIKSAEAIARGLTDGHHATPGYWIQVSGATLVSCPEIEKGLFGEPSDKVYSDVNDVEEIRDLIHRYSAKRVSDSFIFGLAGIPCAPRTAIIFLPTIYGRGSGPVNQRSVQVPELARVTLQRRMGMCVGRGLNFWSNAHITDASQLFLKLVEKAVDGEDGSYCSNENGLYFAENGKMIGIGWVSFFHEGDHWAGGGSELSSHGGVLWGTNAWLKAHRAREYLDWAPTGLSLEKEIPQTVIDEATRLGLGLEQ